MCLMFRFFIYKYKIRFKPNQIKLNYTKIKSKSHSQFPEVTSLSNSIFYPISKSDLEIFTFMTIQFSTDLFRSTIESFKTITFETTKIFTNFLRGAFERCEFMAIITIKILTHFFRGTFERCNIFTVPAVESFIHFFRSAF